MSAERTARLFVALDLPASVRVALAQWGRAAAATLRTPAGQLRLCDAQMLHVTVCFLGSRPLAEIDMFTDALSAVGETSTMGELSLGAPLWLPARRPRVLAVEIHDDAEGTLHDLHQTVLRELCAVCELEPECRRFRAHVTVARMGPRDAPRERTLAATPALRFRPAALVLYRSWLSPSGSSYEPLAQVALEQYHRPGRAFGDG